MKKLIVLLMAVLLLTGCGSTQAPDTPETTAPESTAAELSTEAQAPPSIGTTVRLPDAESEEASSKATHPSKVELPTEAATPTESVQPSAQSTDVVTPPAEAPTTSPTEAPTSPPTEAPTEAPTESPTEAVRWDTESAVSSLCAQVNAHAESVGLVVDPSCGSWSQPGCTNGVDQRWKLNSALEYIDYLASFAGATRIYCTYSQCPDCNDGWLIWIYY